MRKVDLSEFIAVGDLHVKKDNIEESKRFILWLKDLAIEMDLPIVFLGDQYNDFGIARVEAVVFWNWAYSILPLSVSLTGNHDQDSSGALTFMTGHEDQTITVTKPLLLPDNELLLLPFYRKHDDFLEAIISNGSPRFVICHQEFNGCQYQNGFYSPHGMDLNKIPESVQKIYAGHIHKRQSFGKITYLGSPRQFTRSDIGEEKGITIINLKEGTEQFIPTPIDICPPFLEINIDECSNISKMKLANPERTFINLKGSGEFIKKALKKMPEGAKVRTFPDVEVVQTAVKESQGINTAFFNFAMDYFNKNQLGNQEVKDVLDKVYKTCPSLRNGKS